MAKNDKKLELTWHNKDKSLFYDLKKKEYVWVDKKDPEVLEKARQAEEWCKIASRATKKKWVYKLLPHTAVNKINSFDAIISSAYKITRRAEKTLNKNRFLTKFTNPQEISLEIEGVVRMFEVKSVLLRGNTGYSRNLGHKGARLG